MSLYALIRNAYDPESGKFKLSERDVELEGHLDGNLCRCTGYKPILQAAKSFVLEDLKADLIDSSGDNPTLKLQDNHEDQSDAAISQTNGSCGRPGGCCRDSVDSASCNANESHEVSSTKSSFEKVPGDSTSEEIVSSPPSSDSEHDDGQSRKKADGGVSQIKLIPYIPSTELIFPPSLRKWTKLPICYGDSKKKWFRPTTVQQLVELKHAYPDAKLVGGATEVQIQVRFRNSEFPVSVYVSDIEELSGIEIPESPQTLESMEEIIIGANTPLTEVERICKDLYSQLGRRGLVLKAIAKQLRYFGGRQVF
jgi:xanthine dehydrogenase/oxidase